MLFSVLPFWALIQFGCHFRQLKLLVLPFFAKINETKALKTKKILNQLDLSIFLFRSLIFDDQNNHFQ